VVSRFKFNIGFLKADPVSLLLILSFAHTVSELLVIIYKLETGNVVIPFSALVWYLTEIWKADHDILLLVICNLCTKSHRFRDFSACLQNVNDVTPIFPLIGVAPQIYVGILKGRIRLTISA